MNGHILCQYLMSMAAIFKFKMALGSQ